MISFTAHHYSGQRTRYTPVQVLADRADGTLRLEGLPALYRCALADVRISARVANTVRTLHLPGGAACATLENDAVDLLARDLERGRSQRLLQQLETHPLGRALALLLLTSVLVSLFQWGIPSTARYVAQRAPAEFGEYVLGFLDVVALEPSALPVERQAALRSRFAELAATYPDLPLRLVFRSGVGPNAFALPDGTLVLTDALVHVATRDQQIVAVLAHEAGHVHHRHSVEGWLEGSLSSVVLAFYLGGVSDLADWATWLPIALIGANYSRLQETEADTFALAHLEVSGIQPYHFADLFRTFQRQREQPGEELRYLASHPLHAERIERFERASHAVDPFAREVARRVTPRSSVEFEVDRQLIELWKQNPVNEHLFLWRCAPPKEPVAGIRIIFSHPEWRERRERLRRTAQALGLSDDPSDQELAHADPQKAAAFEREQAAHMRWYGGVHDEARPALLGFEPLDIIEAIDDTPTPSFDAFKRAVSAIGTRDVVRVRVFRREESLVLTYRLR